MESFVAEMSAERRGTGAVGSKSAWARQVREFGRDGHSPCHPGRINDRECRRLWQRRSATAGETDPETIGATASRRGGGVAGANVRANVLRGESRVARNGAANSEQD